MEEEKNCTQIMFPQMCLMCILQILNSLFKLDLIFNPVIPFQDKMLNIFVVF
jgi:hypothetical protein